MLSVCRVFYPRLRASVPSVGVHARLCAAMRFIRVGNQDRVPMGRVDGKRSGCAARKKLGRRCGNRPLGGVHPNRGGPGRRLSLSRDVESRTEAVRSEIRVRELLRFVGRIPLGDRWLGTVEVNGNDVVVRGRDLYERCEVGVLPQWRSWRWPTSKTRTAGTVLRTILHTHVSTRRRRLDGGPIWDALNRRDPASSASRSDMPK